MKKAKLALSFVLVMAVSLVASEKGSAQFRARRAAAAEQVNSGEAQQNQQSRQQTASQASPNQKATAYNVAKSRSQKRQANKAKAGAAASQ